jgi:putative ABC transport system permease protein
MTTPWRKAIRDVWRERTRALLVVLSIGIGLAGFLAVLSTYAILKRELNRGYLATNPASAILTLDAVPGSLLADVMAREDVADADARRIVSGRIRTPSGGSRRLRLFVIRDFTALRISRITSDAGAWPPAAGEVLIERDAFQVARAGIGDSIVVRIGNHDERTLRIAGRVHDEGQAQARMEQTVYGYIAPETLPLLGERAELTDLYIQPSGNRFDRDRVELVAADVRRWLEARGIAVRRMSVPPPGEHPHARIMGLLLLVMAVFGLCIVGLSAVVAANLFLAMMAAERRQIGVMKALGAERTQIAAIYLAEAALLGIAAIAMAIPIAAMATSALSAYMAALLNFDLSSLGVPAWVYLLTIAVGLLAPLAAAAYPVAAATRVTVREALADVATGQLTFGAARFDRLLSRASLTASTPWQLGIRNSLRRRGRTLLTLGTISAAGALFIGALSTRTSMMRSLDVMFGEGTYGSDARFTFDQHMLMIYVFLVIVAGVLATIGSLGQMTATSLNVRDRRRELGVLRTIGATPAMVRGVVISEALFIAIVSWPLSLIGALPIIAVLDKSFTALLFRRGFNMTFSFAAIATWLAISAALAIVSSVVPAIAASRRSIREAVSYE